MEVYNIEARSSAMTGQWEAHLKRIQRGAEPLEPFLEGIENYVRQVVSKVGKPAIVAKTIGTGAAATSQRLQIQPGPANTAAPHTRDSLASLLQTAFGFSSFRPNQEAVCR